MDRSASKAVRVKRDMDLVRKILLDVEAAPAEKPWSLMVSRGTSSGATLNQHLVLLSRAGLINVRNHVQLHGPGDIWSDVTLTWPGHEFLDDIRSEEVWTKTKEQVAKLGGTASLTVVSEIAKGLTRTLLNLP